MKYKNLSVFLFAVLCTDAAGAVYECVCAAIAVPVRKNRTSQYRRTDTKTNSARKIIYCRQFISVLDVFLCVCDDGGRKVRTVWRQQNFIDGRISVFLVHIFMFDVIICGTNKWKWSFDKFSSTCSRPVYGSSVVNTNNGRNGSDGAVT